jgi:hypothetical protein
MSGHHDDDIVTNVSTNPHLDDVINEALASPKRRDFIKAGSASADLYSLPDAVLVALLVEILSN